MPPPKKQPAKKQPAKKQPARKRVAAADPSAPAEPDASPAKRPATPKVGDLVAFTYAVTEDVNVTRRGIVLEVVDTHHDGSDRLDADGHPAPAAAVGWFTEVSDPIAVTDLDW